MEKSFSKIKKALLIGIGGGADIVGTIPTKILLESYGIKSILGGIPWERYSIDPYPGPRPFSQIINKQKLMIVYVGLIKKREHMMDCILVNQKFRIF